MPSDSGQRAAEFHDLAAHAHRVAAVHHGKEVASHRSSSGSAKPLESWIFVVIAATVGLLASLLVSFLHSSNSRRPCCLPSI